MAFLRAAFLVLLVASIGLNGAYELSVASGIMIGYGLLYLIAQTIRIENPGVRSIYAVVAICLVFLCVYITLQSFRFADFPLENPVWKTLRAVIGPVDGAISVVPGQTWADLVTLAPFVAFLTGLHLFQTDREAARLLTALSLITATFAAIGFILFYADPAALGLERKQFYVQSLTSTFVNQNAAGALIGMGLINSLGCSFHGFWLQKRGLASSTSASSRFYYLHLACALIQFLALMLTQSRGALATTGLGVLLLFLLLANQIRLPPSVRALFGDRHGRLLWNVSVVVASVLGFVIFGDRILSRSGVAGSDDGRLCTYLSTAAAIRDNWLLGTGLGSFQSVFPAYRDSTCGGIDGVWELAHNVFLEGLLSLGLVFPSVVTALYAVTFRMLLRGWKTRYDYRYAAAIGFSVVLLITLHSTVDFSLQIPAVALFLATLLCALTQIAYRRDYPVAAPRRKQRVSRDVSPGETGETHQIAS